MPRTNTEIDKDFAEFRDKINNEIGAITARLKMLTDADVADAKADKEELEELANGFETLQTELKTGLGKLETDLKQHVKDKVEASEKLQEVKHSALKEKVDKIDSGITQKITWAIAIGASIVAIVNVAATIYYNSKRQG